MGGGEGSAEAEGGEAMNRKRETKREAEARCFMACTRALSSYLRRDDVNYWDTEAVVAMLSLRWTRSRKNLVVTLAEQ